MPQPVIAEISPAGGIVRSVCLLAVGDGIGVAGHLRAGVAVRWALIGIDGPRALIRIDDARALIRIDGIRLGGIVALVKAAADDRPGGQGCGADGDPVPIASPVTMRVAVTLISRLGRAGVGGAIAATAMTDPHPPCADAGAEEIIKVKALATATPPNKKFLIVNLRPFSPIT